MKAVQTKKARRSERRRWVLAAVLALLVAGFALSSAACGSSDEESTTTAAVSTTSTGESTTTSVVEPSTESSSTTASSDVTSESTDTTEGSTTTTEALSSAETRLPNGNIKAMGFVQAAWEEGGTRYISIDYAEMLTGQEAVDAAHDAGDLPLDQDWVDNDYYISNVNPMLRDFAVSDSVSITTATFESVMDQSIGWDVFERFWTEFPPEGGEHMSEMPWWIERDGNTIVSIDEQYLP